jgi:hypothetical protein
VKAGLYNSDHAVTVTQMECVCVNSYHGDGTGNINKQHHLCVMLLCVVVEDAIYLIIIVPDDI